ncbi:outer membrane protein assembly factor BamA [Caminibacter sp.]
MKKFMFLIPMLIFAQDIEKIEYKGLIHISPLSANAIIKTTPHSTYDIEKIDKSIKALYNTGYFKTIKADYNNGVLTFICEEKPTILNIKLNNLSEELKKVLKENNYLPKKGSILNPKKLKELKEFIKSYYIAKGYFNTVVDIKTKPVDKNRIILEVNVYKGKKVAIRKINFFGASLDKDDLIDLTENQPKTFWSFLPIFNSGELNLYKLPEDQKKIQDYYLNLGYLDAKVSIPLAKANLDSYFADIDYKIQEGKRYTVKKVEVKYPKEINVTLPELELKKDKYFNIYALREDIKNISHAFMDKGYAYAKVYPDIKKEKDYAFITYKVIPGQIVYIKNVIITENDKTLDRVIRRNIYLAPGDKFSYTNFEDSINSLKRTGYFEDVKIEKKQISKNEMNLIVHAKDGLSGSLRAGISYGSYTKFGVNFAITERNVFGSGQKITLNADLSSVSKTFNMSLYNPRVLDTKYSMNFSIFDDYFEGISYTSHKKGGYIGIGRMLNRYVNAHITYGYEKDKLSDYDVSDEYIKPQSTKSYIVTSLNYNNTDDYFFPTKGIKASASIEYAGIGGDEEYIKAIAKGKYFYPIKDKTYKTIAVLKYRAIGGVAVDNGYLPINEKFYIGGPSTVRGFSSYSISPKDKDGNEIGGKYEFITGVEVSTPINEKIRMWLTGFIDYGAVGEDSLDISRASYGIQLEWITPMGPLSFILANPLKSKDEDDLKKFEFSMGANF